MAEEKEPKPKKQYEIKVIIWDDGEIDGEMYEYRQNKSGRGAPGKWRLPALDFVRRLEETLGDPEHILNDIHNIVGGSNVTSQEVKKIVAENVTPKVEEIKQTPKGKQQKSKAGADESTDPDVDNMDFGNFDKGDNK